LKIAYLDCSAGISGNMFLGALLDLGLPREYLFTELNKLQVGLPEIVIGRVERAGISAVLVDVREQHSHQHQHRSLGDIETLINVADFNKQVKEGAIECFRCLAVAEAKIHNLPVEEVHFHEVGAIDAIIDIVGTMIGVTYFEFDTIISSSVRVGNGTVKCAHGEIPLPAPATLELLKDFTIYGGEIAGEWTTPTGAALLKTLAVNCASLPKFQLKTIGYGAGNAQRKIPNVLRLISGEDYERLYQEEEQVIIETNIDDMNPEYYGYLGEKLLLAGVKDYFYTPVYMKKNRPATQLTVIVSPDLVNGIENLIFNETTTFGLRKHLVQRACMERSEITVKVDESIVRVKTGVIAGQIIKLAPEYEDCLKLAKETGQTLRAIYEKASEQAKQNNNLRK
jgi:uncharacterized protein (TIGR00299 family) protein